MNEPRNAGKKAKGGLAASKLRFVAGVTIPLLLYESLGIFVLGWAFVLMFFDYSPGRVGGPILGLGGSNPFIGLGHFIDMIKGNSVEATLFRTSLKNTLIFAVAVLPLNLLITLPLAWLLESVGNRFKSLYRTIYFLPVLTSSVGVALIWMSMYDPQAGWINAIIRAFGGKPVSWLSDPNAGVAGVLGGDVGCHPCISMAGLRLQHGHFHCCLAGGSAGIKRCSRDRRCQLLAGVSQDHHAAHPPDDAVCVRDDHAFLLPGIRYHPGDDQWRSRKPDPGADAGYL